MNALPPLPDCVDVKPNSCRSGYVQCTKTPLTKHLSIPNTKNCPLHVWCRLISLYDLFFWSSWKYERTITMSDNISTPIYIYHIVYWSISF
jgi:hypothetical protein